MPDRHITREFTSPEEILDRWLDALNDPDQDAPSALPEEIAGTAHVARRYHHALGMSRVTPRRHANVERNGLMTPHVLTDTVPTAIPRTGIPPRAADRRALPGWLSGGLATAAMVALVVALVGGGLVRQFGLPGVGDGSPDRMSLFAPGTATPESEALACAAPGYRPIVEGGVNEDTLSALGITEAPLQVDGDTIRIPTSSGEIVELPGSWTPLPASSLWTDAQSGESFIETTVLNVETGEEWLFPSTGISFLPAYHAPYLIVPMTHSTRDWRIIETVTGEERLISGIRGEEFTHAVTINQIYLTGGSPRAEPDHAIWVFMPSYVSGANQQAALETLGPNVLLPGDTLDDAMFLPDTIDSDNMGNFAYSAATGRLAYPTDTDAGRIIIVLDTESGDRFEIDDAQLGDEVLPLMFSEDGTRLIVDEPGALFSIELSDDPVVTVLHDDETFVPIAVNTRASRILLKYEDQHLAFVDADTGEVTDMPGVVEPPSTFGPSESLYRGAYEVQIYYLFDDATSTVRFVNLITGTVSETEKALNPELNVALTAIQPRFWYHMDFPYVEWTDGYGYLDDAAMFHAISARDDDETFTIPAPEDLSVGADQLVQLIVNPDESCLVLNVVDAEAEPGGNEVREPGRVTTWIAPLEPGAEWTKLDIAIMAWWEVYDGPDAIILPAPGVTTPVATPEG